MKRTTLASVALIALAAASPAQAEIRKGSVYDPKGDGTTLDIIEASASYDTNGEWSVQFYTDPAPNSVGRFFISAKLGSFSSPDLCTGSTASAFGFSDAGLNAFSSISGIPGLGSAFVYIDPNFGGIQVKDKLVANLDYSCVTLTLASADPGAVTFDSLNVPIFFDGFGPPRCAPPASAWNKPLPAARKALEKANCKVGQVKKPKGKLRKGYVLVTSKVEQRKDGTNKVDVTLKAKKR